MTWQVIYHPDVLTDLLSIGQAEARTILSVITKRIQNGEQEKLGKPLAGTLSGCRRIRTGNTRIVYRIHAGSIEVFIIAVGNRRNSEVYAAAEKRL